MKVALMALILIGTIQGSATAQSTKKSKYDVNYKVCKVGDKYKTCDENTPAFAPAKDEAKAIKQQTKELRKLDEHVYAISSPASAKKNPRFIATYDGDDPQSAYNGKESMINDGVEKNKARNVNYLDMSVNLPPSDGNNASK